MSDFQSKPDPADVLSKYDFEDDMELPFGIDVEDHNSNEIYYGSSVINDFASMADDIDDLHYIYQLSQTLEGFILDLKFDLDFSATYLTRIKGIASAGKGVNEKALSENRAALDLRKDALKLRNKAIKLSEEITLKLSKLQQMVAGIKSMYDQLSNISNNIKANGGQGYTEDSPFEKLLKK